MLRFLHLILILVFGLFLLPACSKKSGGDALITEAPIADATPAISFSSHPAINSVNQSNFSLTGTCSPEAETIILTISSMTSSTTCVSGSWSHVMDLSSLADSPSHLLSAELAGVTQSITLVKDTSVPSVSTTTIADARYVLGDQVLIDVTFSEVVLVTGTPRVELQLDSQSSTSLFATYLSGSGSSTLRFSYAPALGDQDSNGIQLVSSIDLNSGTITDSNLNPATLTGLTTTYPLVSVDTQVPVISSLIAPANGVYAENGQLLFQINFSQAVNVTGTPRLVINVGGVSRYANYSGGHSTSGIEFSYSINALDQDLDGIELSSTSIDLNGGSIRAVVDNDPSALNFAGYVPSMAEVKINNSLGITAPAQVTGVTSAPTTSNSQLSITWQVPNNNGTPITHYVLQYRESGASTWITASQPTTNSSTLGPLSAGVVYEVRVAANNGLLGPYSIISNVEVFDVSSLNPIAWLSSTNVTNGGSEPAANDKVGLWSDLTQTATDAVETNTANQPFYRTNVQNGLPAIEFTGAQDRGLEGTFTRVNNSGLSIFLVGKFTGTARRAFFEFYKIGPADNSPDARRGFFFTYGYGNSATNSNLNNTQFNLWRVYDDGVKSTLWQNGTALYTNKTNEYGRTDYTGAGAYVLGDDKTGGDRLTGFIGELLIFDRQLTTQEAETLSNYLKNKWGTP